MTTKLSPSLPLEAGEIKQSQEGARLDVIKDRGAISSLASIEPTMLILPHKGTETGTLPIPMYRADQ